MHHVPYAVVPPIQLCQWPKPPEQALSDPFQSRGQNERSAEAGQISSDSTAVLYQQGGDPGEGSVDLSEKRSSASGGWYASPPAEHNGSCWPKEQNHNSLERAPPPPPAAGGSAVRAADGEGGSLPSSQPRTRLRISDSTQTDPPLASNTYSPCSGGHQLLSPAAAKSHSVSGAAARQLSLSLRQQLRVEAAAAAGGVVTSAAGSRPVTTTGGGALIDSPYASYMQWRCSTGSPSAQRPSSAYTSHVTTPQQGHQALVRGCLTDAESVESMASGGAMPFLLHHQQQQQQLVARSVAAGHSPQLSGAAAASSRQLQLSNCSGYLSSQSPTLQRNNSLRSSHSEQVYPNTPQQQQQLQQLQQQQQQQQLQQQRWQQQVVINGDSAVDEVIYGHLTGVTGSRDVKQLSPTRASTTGRVPAQEAHGSSLSLVSNTSSIYSSHEDKMAGEIRRLRRELTESHQKVHSLSNQLNTNGHVVEAFEQSLTSMTKKIHALMTSGEQKDRQIAELRRSLQLCRQLAPPSPSHHASNDSISSGSSNTSSHSQQQQQQPPHHQQRQHTGDSKKKKKKTWFTGSPQLRHSFGKAFARKKSRALATDCQEGGANLTAAAAAAIHSASSSPARPEYGTDDPASLTTSSTTTAAAGSTKCSNTNECGGEAVVAQLRRELQQKDSLLTELRLQALASASQLEQWREATAGVRREMALVRQDNERLQQLLACRSLSPTAAASPSSSAPLNSSYTTTTTTTTSSSAAAEKQDSPLSAVGSVSVEAAAPDDRVLSVLVLSDVSANSDRHKKLFPVGRVRVGRTTSWSSLDTRLATVLAEYMQLVDASQCLCVGWEAVLHYQLGDQVRTLSHCQQPPHCPDLLPWGYVVGDTSQLLLTLAGYHQRALDAFIFENLVPRAVAQKFVSLLMERRRVVLAGQRGTGKTFLAHRLAEYVIASCSGDGLISSFTVQPSGAEQLQLFLDQLMCGDSMSASQTTQVVIIDNLHHVTSSSAVMTSLAGECRSHADLYIIGTADQLSAPASLPATVGWLPCVCHLEPARGLLARCLRRKQVSATVAPSSGDICTTGAGSCEQLQQLSAVLEWIPRLWSQLNSFLDLHCSADVNIGPCVLLECPSDVAESQRWFAHLWNRVLAPHVCGAVRRALLSHGRRASWHDPAQFVVDTYPWLQREAPDVGLHVLTRLPAEQVGYHVDGAGSGAGQTGPDCGPQPGDGGPDGEMEDDPLLGMLRSLQQAAEYRGPGGQVTDPPALLGAGRRAVLASDTSQFTI